MPAIPGGGGGAGTPGKGGGGGTPANPGTPGSGGGGGIPTVTGAELHVSVCDLVMFSVTAESLLLF